jgi:hypothetical protein
VQIEALFDAARLIDAEQPGLSWRDGVRNPDRASGIRLAH